MGLNIGLVDGLFEGVNLGLVDGLDIGLRSGLVSNDYINNNILLDGVGNGLKLDGVNDRISTPLLFPFQPSSVMTIAFLVSLQTPWVGLVWTLISNSVSNVGTDIGIIKCDTNGVNQANGDFIKIELRMTDNAGIRGVGYRTVPFIDNSSHYSIIWNNVTKKFWINGVDVGTVANSNGTTVTFPLPTTNPHILGWFNSAQPQYSGITYYDFKHYSKSLSNNEINLLYKTNHNEKNIISNLTTNYDFNQKSGTTLIDRVSAQNGTLVNFANTTPSIGNAWVNSIGNSILN